MGRQTLKKHSQHMPKGLYTRCVCMDPESYARGGPTLTAFFYFIFFLLVDEGRKDPNTSISGPSSARQQNAIKWHFAGMPMLAQHTMLAW